MGARTVDEETIRRWISENSPSQDGSSLLSATVELTDAQIKALPTTSIQVIAAPGVGKIAYPIHYMLICDTTAASYTNVHADGDWFLETDAGFFGTLSANKASESLAQLTDLLGFGATGIASGVIQQGYNSATYQTFIPVNLLTVGLENKAVLIGAQNTGGNYTGGDAANYMKVKVYYVEIDL
jgi:hypothetical protein